MLPTLLDSSLDEGDAVHRIGTATRAVAELTPFTAGALSFVVGSLPNLALTSVDRGPRVHGLVPTEGTLVLGVPFMARAENAVCEPPMTIWPRGFVGCWTAGAFGVRAGKAVGSDAPRLRPASEGAATVRAFLPATSSKSA